MRTRLAASKNAQVSGAVVVKGLGEQARGWDSSKGQPLRGGWRNGSVVLRQEHSCGRPVGLSYDPEPYTVSVVIGGQEAQGLIQGEFIFSSILFAQVPPVAAGVAANCPINILGVEGA